MMEGKGLITRQMSHFRGFVEDAVGRLRGRPDEAFDELVHVFLVPCRAVDDGYAVKVWKSMAPGVPELHDGSRRVIFHVPSVNSEFLATHLFAQLSSGDDGAVDDDTAVSMLLDRAAAAVETAGFAARIGIVAGAVAVNPVLGIATLLSIAASEDGDVADSLRERAGKRRERATYERGLKKVKRAKPVLRVNPLLKRLDDAVSGRLPDPGSQELCVRDYDSLSNEFTEEGQTHRSLTVEAIRSVYQENDTLGLLDRRVRAWVEHLS